AFDTATALAEHTGLTVVPDVRLRETNHGDWEGLTHLEVDADYPGAPPAPPPPPPPPRLWLASVSGRCRARLPWRCRRLDLRRARPMW
uniref:histidine phosphatase family protein n=1 Tax=Nocardia gipuzkoensis TaxID=2749991 RepID=UPI0024543CE8